MNIYIEYIDGCDHNHWDKYNADRRYEEHSECRHTHIHTQNLFSLVCSLAARINVLIWLIEIEFSSSSNWMYVHCWLIENMSYVCLALNFSLISLRIGLRDKEIL